MVQITAVSSASKMTGIRRILMGTQIPNPFGNADFTPEQEKALRRRYMKRALDLLQTEVKETTLFTLDGKYEE